MHAKGTRSAEQVAQVALLADIEQDEPAAWDVACGSGAVTIIIPLHVVSAPCVCYVAVRVVW